MWAIWLIFAHIVIFYFSFAFLYDIISFSF